MSFGDDRDLEENEQREKDRRDAQDQVDQITESLEREGRYIDAGVIRALAGHCADMVSVIMRLRSKLQQLAPKKKRQTVKTSGGKERANASGTINKPEPDYGPNYKPLGIAPPKAFTQSLKGGHKHDYAPESGQCIKFTDGVSCPAKRQRQRKAKQTTIPGVDGAKTSEAGS